MQPAETRPSRLFSSLLGNPQPLILFFLVVAAVTSLLSAGLSARPRLARAEATASARRRAALEGQGTPLLTVDPAMEIIRKIVSRQFDDRRDVVTHRLLDRFDEVAAFLEHMDDRQARCLHRGAGWSQIEAPLSQPEGEEGPVQKVRLRFLKEDRTWRLDQSRLLPVEPAS
jgi:hypothetical protein